MRNLLTSGVWVDGDGDVVVVAASVHVLRSTGRHGDGKSRTVSTADRTGRWVMHCWSADRMHDALGSESGPIVK